MDSFKAGVVEDDLPDPGVNEGDETVCVPPFGGRSQEKGIVAVAENLRRAFGSCGEENMGGDFTKLVVTDDDRFLSYGDQHSVMVAEVVVPDPPAVTADPHGRFNVGGTVDVMVGEAVEATYGHPLDYVIGHRSLPTPARMGSFDTC